MFNKGNWLSLSHIHHLYRRFQFQQFFQVLASFITGTLLIFTILALSLDIFSLSDFSINLWFCVLGGLLLFTIFRFIKRWSEMGFRLSTYFKQWERYHPEVSNRASLLVYSEKQSNEIGRLGYSQELLHAEDQWLNEYIHKKYQKKQSHLFWNTLIICFVVILSSLAYYWTNPSFVHSQAQKISNALFIRSVTSTAQVLRVPEERQVARGQSITLSATSNNQVQPDSYYVHLNSGNGWHTTQLSNIHNAISYKIPAVHQQIEYYFSSPNGVSNRGVIIPLDPPTIASGTVEIAPPAYTSRPKEVLTGLRSLTVPEGSNITIQATATTPLNSASLIVNNVTRDTSINGKSVKSTFKANQPGDFNFKLKDIHNLNGESRHYRLSITKDATPTVEILKPPLVSDMPTDLKPQIQVKVKDDYSVHRVYFISITNENPKTKREHFIWAYTQETAKDVGAATQFYLTWDWDMEPLEMFPGDSVTYYVQAWDDDQINGPKMGQSQKHEVRYPSLTDLLGLLEEEEDQQVTQLSDVVEEQKQIGEDLKETIGKIDEKKDRSLTEEESDESLWLEKNELESLKERQEKLVEEAKKIEEELSKYQQKTDDQLSEEEKKEQGFTPETVEKMTRIQELLNDLLDKDSRELIQKIEEAVDQMSKKIQDDQLQDLEFSMTDFQSQLDRTLSMLEDTYQTRQLEGLRNMAQELSERQDHLERETDQLSQKKEALEKELQETQQEAEQNPTDQETNEHLEELKEQKTELEKQEAILSERQKTLAEDVNKMMEKMNSMQQNLNEKNPQIAEQLQKMLEQTREGNLQEEVNKASEQLEQGQPQKAQPHQKNAQNQLAQMANQLQQQMFNMGGMNMEMDTQALKRLIDRSIFLSHQQEGLTHSPSGQARASLTLRYASILSRELSRIQEAWTEISKTNPFMSREVDSYLHRSQERLQHAIQAGQGESWVGVHESRQSLMALNTAIYKMQQDMQSMQQQMNQSQNLQQQMQQMISQQKNLNQMLQELRKMGEKGQKMMEQLQSMARQQARIRKEIEQMMRQYRHARQLRNQLEGIYNEMEEVEKLLEEGQNNEEVENKQKRIMTRMLEAGTMQEKDEFGKERKAQTAESGKEGSTPSEDYPLSVKERIRQAVDRPADESIPLPYREAIKNLYIRLSESMGE